MHLFVQDKPAWFKHTLYIPLVIAHLASALAPLFVMLALYALSWIAMRTIGHWPIPMIDDPKFIPAPPIYDQVGSIYEFACGWFMISLIAFPVLSAALWASYSPKQRWLLAILFLVSWASILCEPTGRIAWIAD